MNGNAQLYVGTAIRVNGSALADGFVSQYTTNAHVLQTLSIVTTLSANDTVNIIFAGTAAGTATIQGGIRSHFMGYLIG